MNKSDLAKTLAEREKLPLNIAEQVVNLIFQEMSKTMIQGGRIEIRGFGAFTVREYSGYEGRNPKTGEVVQVKPKRLPYFRVGLELKKRVEGK